MPWTTTDGVTVMPLPGSDTPIADDRIQDERQREAGDDAERRPEEPDDEAFEAQRALDLLRCRADRRQHRQLAQPLRHDDAEGVVDHEGADEQRQQRRRPAGRS